ncbi:hypothetical protein SAMN04489735_100265 [Aneurinibacillus thermoaerophilus]|uniref:Uncharacterized protein n=1 Tax=Aneurinibacillus thermoaerophilus TaxID=143495 RepID=A0A1G7WQI2_ANETH|nr:hypothetical protein [Aneurinibacillus thermoaerophilus]SDG74202.1 hypothetical protein SAMN04489735_100265 [Aneurinibacillus thermoaerophilus]
MDFFRDLYNLFVALVAGLFGIAVSNGTVDKFASMFLLLSLFTIAVLTIEYTTLLTERKLGIKDLALPVIKSFCTLAIFLFFSIGAILSIGIDNYTSTFLYFITWSYTGLIVSAYLVQILTFGKKLGIPGMAKLIEIVEQFSTIFTRYKK